MSQNHPIHKRRQHYIKKEFQFNFIMKFCGILALGSIVSTALIYLVSKDSLTTTVRGAKLMVKSTADVMLPAIITTNLITLALITLAAVFVTLYISHKIAGPLFRFEKDIEMVGEGDLTVTFRLRKNDQLTDLVDNLNTMTAATRERIVDIHGQIDALARQMEDDQGGAEYARGARQIKQKLEEHFKF
jgi:methyl-accepting chemotaxis protein